MTDREPHELEAAQAFADEGGDVRLTLEDHGRQGMMSIDAWVRWAADDEGVATELKSLRTTGSPAKATKAHIVKAGKQLAQQAGVVDGLADGQVFIDGRRKGLTSTDAVHALQRTIGQANGHGQTLPGKVIFLLGDGRVLAFWPVPRVRPDGSVQYERPDNASLQPVGREDVGWSRMWRNRWPH